MTTPKEATTPESAAGRMLAEAHKFAGDTGLPILEALQLMREAMPPRFEEVPTDVHIPPANVYQALVNVAREVEPVSKDREHRGAGGGETYKFRGIDDVMNAIHASMARNGVLPVPNDDYAEDLDASADRPWTYESVVRGGGKPWRHHLLRTRWTILGPNGTSLEIPILSEALDNQDKGLGKARSYGMKDLLLRLLTLPTDDPNTDNEHAQIPEADGQRYTSQGQPAREGRRRGSTPRQAAPTAPQAPPAAPVDADADARATGFEDEAHRLRCHNEVAGIRKALPESYREQVRSEHQKRYQQRWPLTAEELTGFREYVEALAEIDADPTVTPPAAEQ